ncbi:MAG: hypothetical protein HY270_09315 [Deltaproteobacteria bacterium]|nr:hypothetical protein [Deltaproteobacteria bacterium]
MLHAFILFPYYFFGALTILLLSMIVSRVLRLGVSINVLVGIAIAAGILGLAIPLAADVFDLHQLGGKPMLVLAASTFVLAAVDAVLAKVLPLALDTELKEI